MYASKIWAWILAAVLGYLLGSVSGSITVSRFFYKDDIRKYGSGNAGTTNMLRTYGKAKAAMTILIDFAKTMIAIAVGRYLIGFWGVLVCGVAVTMGHAYPVYYGFKGGKAAACSAASMLMLHPAVFLTEAAVFFGSLFVKKTVSISTLLVAATFPFTTAFVFRGILGSAEGISYMVFALYISVFVTYLHRANIKRLREGTELSFDKKGKGK